MRRHKPRRHAVAGAAHGPVMAAFLALALLAVPARASPQTLAAPEHGRPDAAEPPPLQPLQVRLLPEAAKLGAASALQLRAPAGDALARSLAAAGRVSLLEQGVSSARQALIECQKGDYPGGGMGLLSLPSQRPEAQTDHCRRF